MTTVIDTITSDGTLTFSTPPNVGTVEDINDNTTKLASTAFVINKIESIVGSISSLVSRWMDTTSAQSLPATTIVPQTTITTVETPNTTDTLQLGKSSDTTITIGESGSIIKLLGYIQPFSTGGYRAWLTGCNSATNFTTTNITGSGGIATPTTNTYTCTSVNVRKICSGVFKVGETSYQTSNDASISYLNTVYFPISFTNTPVVCVNPNQLDSGLYRFAFIESVYPDRFIVGTASLSTIVNWVAFGN